jgi:hypothetical protein
MSLDQQLTIARRALGGATPDQITEALLEIEDAEHERVRAAQARITRWVIDATNELDA